eukprot:359971-Chlamydomonas_euryale.AAC.9
MRCALAFGRSRRQPAGAAAGDGRKRCAPCVEPAKVTVRMGLSCQMCVHPTSKLLCWTQRPPGEPQQRCPRSSIRSFSRSDKRWPGGMHLRSLLIQFPNQVGVPPLVWPRLLPIRSAPPLCGMCVCVYLDLLADPGLTGPRARCIDLLNVRPAKRETKVKTSTRTCPHHEGLSHHPGAWGCVGKSKSPNTKLATSTDSLGSMYH